MKIYHIFYAGTVAKIRFADGTIQEIKGPAAEIIDTSTVREIDPSSAKELFGTPSVKEIEDKSDPTLVAKTIEVTARDISKTRIVPGSSKHRAQQIIARNGKAHADEGRIIKE